MESICSRNTEVLEIASRNKKIVWIEDKPKLFSPHIEPLQANGFSIIQCGSYVEAFAHMDDIRTSNLTLLDLIFPFMRDDKPTTLINALRNGLVFSHDDDHKKNIYGLSLLRYLRKELQLEIPILVFSYFLEGEPIVPVGTLRALRSCYLDKVCHPNTLMAKVNRMLGRYGI